MKQRAGLLGQHADLLEKMRDAVVLSDALDLIPLLNAANAAIEKASESVAFTGKGPEQWARCGSC